MLTLNKQVWIRQLMEKFYPDTSFLKYAKDFSTLTENDKINLAEAGVDPEVYINNTTYPIAVEFREDTPLEIPLDKFETKNTAVRRPDAIEYAYDQLESVLMGHRNVLRTTTAKKAAHAFAPSSDAAHTPVIVTTGETVGTRKRITIKDILSLKTRFDLLDYPLDKRYLVLDPNHVEDLMLEDLKVFKDIIDLVNGQPSRFAGFNMLQSTQTPRYNKTTLAKVAFNAAYDAANHTFSSFCFYGDEVMKADGVVYMYATIDDPKERATIVGFDKRFIAMPIRSKGVGAIVSTVVS
ncbi:MAG TPA: hypothetical protein VF623_14130 [Segetibacter sp.]